MPRIQQVFVNYLKRSFNFDENEGEKLWTRRFAAAGWSAAATTVDIDITTFNGGLEILGAYAWLAQNFTGGAVATATLSVGTTGTPTAYINAQNLFAGAPTQRPGVTLVPGTFLNAPANASGTVRFRLIVTGANTSALTTGVVDVFLILRAVKLKLTTPTG